jgi:outer membrane protein assembly factor BamB
LKRRNILIIAIGLISIIIVSSLVIYANSILNPEGSLEAWRRDIPNFATALSADDGKVFTMDISGNVNCYDQQTGASIWNGSSVGGYFAEGLTVGEGRVYGGFHYASVGCLDEATGQFQWSQMNTAGVNQAPDSITIKDGRLFVVSEGPAAGVAALNASTGQNLWQTPNRFDIFGNISDSNTWWVAGYPLGGDPFAGNLVYALGGNGSNANIFKLNTDNGSIIWRSNLTSFAGIPSVLTTYKGQVVVESGTQILSLNQSSGEYLWHNDLGASMYQPTVKNDLLLFGASDGCFYGLNLSSGLIQWKTSVDSQNLMSTVNNDNITLTSSTIQVQNNWVYWNFGVTQQLGTSSADKHDRYLGTIISLDLANGSLAWSRQIEDLGVFFGFTAGLVVNKDAVFLNENNALWVFGASNGNVAKNRTFDHYVLAPVELGNVVYVASDLQLTAYK